MKLKVKGSTLFKELRVFKGNDGQYYFTIVGKNGQVLVTSEGYTRKWSAWRGAIAAKKTLKRGLS